jgi:RNA polymerase sigma factor (TIGR02999 family)
VNDVTRILNAIGQGDAGATEKLLPLVYEELRLLAAQKLSRESPGQTLQATALVHEAYLRLVGGQAQSWDSQGHFFAAAAEAMRRILVENARRKCSEKHGGSLRRVDLESCEIAMDDSSDDLLALDEALDALAKEDTTTAEVVKLRYFAGLSPMQVGGILGISERTARRYWVYGRVWLLRALTRSDGPAR